MEKYIREPINTLTHAAGALFSVLALIAMIIKTYLVKGSAITYTAVIIFGISMILLYTASSTYHGVKAKDKVIAFLRRIDHSMIFILITGSYAPFCLITLNGPIGYIFFTVIASIAICGVIFKMVWFNCPRWLSTALYIGLGWFAMFVVSPLSKNLEAGGLNLLILGGIFYTVGGIIYGAKPKFLQFKSMGFHEIFHIFILLGSLSHFLSVFLYVL